MTDTVQRITFLKKIHLFRGLSDDQLTSVAEQLEDVSFKARDVVFQQGDLADAFYLIYSGRVNVSRLLPNKQNAPLGHLVPGDYFGEEGALTGHRRSATITAEASSFMLKLDAAKVKVLLRQIPSLRSNFEVMITSRQLARELHFDWLGQNEVIYFLARKHPVLLVQSLVLPVIGLLIPIGLLGASLFITSDIPWLLAIFSFLGLVLWAVWKWIDWGNDFYIVTNQRVIWLEKVVGIYDSRQEAPLHTILSVGVETDYMGRQFNFGAVNVRTFVGSIQLAHVGHPKQAAAMIEEYWARTKESARQNEQDTMQDAIRGKLGMPSRPIAEKPAAPAVKKEYKPSLLQITAANLLKLRFEDSEVITYRKHWFVLLRNTAKQMCIFLGLLAAMALWPVITGAFMPTWMFTLSLAGLIGDAAWWAYDYIDWANDIYQVTPEQIVDLYRKPLGREDRKAAPLENILSTEYQRHGLPGLLLNYGKVSIMVGGSRFDFDDVFDPPQVQQDIIRRMSARIAKRKEGESLAERERMADWLSAYHHLAEETRETEKRKPGNPE